MSPEQPTMPPQNKGIDTLRQQLHDKRRKMIGLLRKQQNVQHEINKCRDAIQAKKAALQQKGIFVDNLTCDEGSYNPAESELLHKVDEVEHWQLLGRVWSFVRKPVVWVSMCIVFLSVLGLSMYFFLNHGNAQATKLVPVTLCNTSTSDNVPLSAEISEGNNSKTITIPSIPPSKCISIAFTLNRRANESIKIYYVDESYSDHLGISSNPDNVIVCSITAHPESSSGGYGRMGMAIPPILSYRSVQILQDGEPHCDDKNSNDLIDVSPLPPSTQNYLPVPFVLSYNPLRFTLCNFTGKPALRISMTEGNENAFTHSIINDQMIPYANCQELFVSQNSTDNCINMDFSDHADLTITYAFVDDPGSYSSSDKYYSFNFKDDSLIYDYPHNSTGTQHVDKIICSR